jgi:hypothetical protein
MLTAHNRKGSTGKNNDDIDSFTIDKRQKSLQNYPAYAPRLNVTIDNSKDQ